MNEPRLPIWNSDNSDVLPEFQLTFGHCLLRGVPSPGWQDKLFKALGLGAPTQTLAHLSLPRHEQNGCLVFGSGDNLHLVVARLADVWAVFGPHTLFFSTKSWIEFNSKVGGALAFATQMDVGEISYLIFQNGVKQTNVFLKNGSIRVVDDSPVDIYINNQPVKQEFNRASMSESQVRELIEHDLSISDRDNQVVVLAPRFPTQTGSVSDVTHFVFSRTSKKTGFFRFPWST